MSAPLVLLFALECTKPCGLSDVDLKTLDAEAKSVLLEQGAQVEDATAEHKRPTGEHAPLQPVDQAARFHRDVVIALDMEGSTESLHVTVFARGVVGPKRVRRLQCKRSEKQTLACLGLRESLQIRFRPPKSHEVDVMPALRELGRRIERCVQDEDRVPAVRRVFGRLELHVEANQKGVFRLLGVRPRNVESRGIGRCLRAAVSQVRVSPFEGKPLRLTLPLDL